MMYRIIQYTFNKLCGKKNKQFCNKERKERKEKKKEKKENCYYYLGMFKNLTQRIMIKTEIHHMHSFMNRNQ